MSQSILVQSMLEKRDLSNCPMRLLSSMMFATTG